MATIPILVLYLFFQRYFVEGVAAVASRGEGATARSGRSAASVPRLGAAFRAALIRLLFQLDASRRRQRHLGRRADPGPGRGARLAVRRAVVAAPAGAAGRGHLPDGRADRAGRVRRGPARRPVAVSTGARSDAPARCHRRRPPRGPPDQPARRDRRGRTWTRNRLGDRHPGGLGAGGALDGRARRLAALRRPARSGQPLVDRLRLAGGLLLVRPGSVRRPGAVVAVVASSSTRS